MIQLDHTIAEILSYLIENVQSTDIDTDEQKGLFNSFLQEIGNYYLLSQNNDPNSNLQFISNRFPSIEQELSKGILLLQKMLNPEQPFYKIDHVFQTLVKKMSRSKEIDVQFLDLIQADQRFQSEEIQRKIVFLKKKYSEQSKNQN